MLPNDLRSVPLKAWSMLGGLDWVGLPMVAEMLGVDDIEWLACQLMTIRDFYHARQ